MVLHVLAVNLPRNTFLTFTWTSVVFCSTKRLYDANDRRAHSADRRKSIVRHWHYDSNYRRAQSAARGKSIVRHWLYDANDRRAHSAASRKSIVCHCLSVASIRNEFRFGLETVRSLVWSWCIWLNKYSYLLYSYFNIVLVQFH